MNKKSYLKKFLLSFVFCLMAIICLAIGNGNAYASSGVNVTFDIDIERLQKYMPESSIAGLKNSTITVQTGESLSFPTFSSSVNEYYRHSWMCNGEEIDEETFSPIQDCVINIVWEPIEYTIYYNYNTLEEKSQITNIKYSDTYSVEKQVVYYLPYRPYYKFVDWYSSPACLDSEIAEVYTDKYARGDKYIYAKWTPVVYNINYNTDAENLSNPPIYTYETPTFNLETPKKEGHIFEGWYLDSEFTNPISKIEKGSKGNINLYPKWKLEERSVKYILPDGECEEVKVQYGKDADKPNINTNIFTVLKFDKSTKNITEDTEIKVKKISIWYVYVIALVLIVGIVLLVIFLKKNNEKKLHKLRQKYQTNLKGKKRNIK